MWEIINFCNEIWISYFMRRAIILLSFNILLKFVFISCGNILIIWNGLAIIFQYFKCVLQRNLLKECIYLNSMLLGICFSDVFKHVDQLMNQVCYYLWLMHSFNSAHTQYWIADNYVSKRASISGDVCADGDCYLLACLLHMAQAVVFYIRKDHEHFALYKKSVFSVC